MTLRAVLTNLGAISGLVALVLLARQKTPAPAGYAEPGMHRCLCRDAGPRAAARTPRDKRGTSPLPADGTRMAGGR